jgi:hypothetical protein
MRLGVRVADARPIYRQDTAGATPRLTRTVPE